jgi:monothiol glutaredoxin
MNMPMDEALREKLQQTIQSDQVVLFMKGTRSRPQCGFSARVIGILDEFLPEYTTVDVLDDPDVRQGIKELSNWPTIPQLYVRGELVGGCDIVIEMHQTGDLEKTLGVGAVEVEPPNVTVTEAAAEAFRNALQGDDEHVRLEVDGRFQNDLSIGPRNPSDVAVESAGLSIVMSRATARRANGVRIDYVRTAEGPAFKIENPNEPPRVKAMMPAELKKKLDAGESLELFDVRTPQEREIARIEPARHLDEETAEHISKLDKGTPLVFFCHHGGRSQAAAEHFLSEGFTNVHNVIGGIDAWSREVDPKVARY